MGKQPFELIIELKDDHLSARASGERNRETVAAVALQVFEAALADQCGRVLVDVRAFKGRLSILESYRIVTEVFQRLRGKGVFKAAILDTRDPTRRIRFLETVARNRDFNFRIFTSRKEALAWLAS